MTKALTRREEEALNWIVRTNDPDFERWDDFTLWLEEDPANASAYHRLADSELSIRPLVERASRPSTIVVPPRETRIGRRRFAIAASVAGLVAASGVIVVSRLSPDSYVTRPGEQRTLALSEHDRLVMNGGTRLSLAGFDRRRVKLDQGEILLVLRDKGEGPVRVSAGDLELVDVGTVFDVSRAGRSTRVLVAEGAVMADPDGARLRLPKGSRLDTRDGEVLLRATSADVSSIGSWKDGQLVYTSEPLENVLADLRRSTGIDFRANAAMRARRFTGTLAVAEVKRDPRSLEPLLGVTMVRSGAGWEIAGGV